MVAADKHEPNEKKKREEKTQHKRMESDDNCNANSQCEKKEQTNFRSYTAHRHKRYPCVDIRIQLEPTSFQ